MTVRFALALVAGLSVAPIAAAQDGGVWGEYRNPTYGYSAELPLGDFEPVGEATANALRLAEIGGAGQISLYAGEAEGMSLEDFAGQLASSDQLRTITYRAGGESWFVLSGYYEPEDEGGEPLIFYTKILLSADGERFSGFEVSYPQGDKARYDEIVSRIEDGFTRPG